MVTVNYKGIEFELKFTTRAMIEYERATGKSFDMSLQTTSIELVLYYIFKTSSKGRITDPFRSEDYSDDFISWIDENGGLSLLTELSNWLQDTMNAQNSMSRDLIESIVRKNAEVEDKGTSKKKGKN